MTIFSFVAGLNPVLSARSFTENTPNPTRLTLSNFASVSSITANVAVRAKRRFLELQERGEKVIEEQVIKDMKERDERDSNRSVAPLVPADDALILDTSDLNADEVFNKAISFIKQKL